MKMQIQLIGCADVEVELMGAVTDLTITLTTYVRLLYYTFVILEKCFHFLHGFTVRCLKRVPLPKKSVRTYDVKKKIKIFTFVAQKWM